MVYSFFTKDDKLTYQDIKKDRLNRLAEDNKINKFYNEKHNEKIDTILSFK